jgi:hypothetical protein
MSARKRHSIPRVALLVETTRTYTRELLAGVRHYIAAHGPWSTFLELRALDSSPPAWLRHWDGDGILTRTFTQEMADLIASTGLPTVELRATNISGGHRFVGMDNAGIGHAVAEHFFERGYRQFAAYSLQTERFFIERVRNFASTVTDRNSLFTYVLGKRAESALRVKDLIDIPSVLRQNHRCRFLPKNASLPHNPPMDSPLLESQLTRRHALQRIALLLGGALSAELAAGVNGEVLTPGKLFQVSKAQVALLAEVADVIIPDTDTPGAKAAGAEQFILRVVRDCYRYEQQEAFYRELDQVEEESRRQFGKTFADLGAEQKQAIVRHIASTARVFFKELRELTVAGYFTSEIGATKALEYLPVPGRFEGSVRMSPGQKAWAI